MSLLQNVIQLLGTVGYYQGKITEFKGLITGSVFSNSGNTMEELLQNKAIIIGLWLILFFALERLRPMAVHPDLTKRPEARGRVIRNALLWFCNTLMSPFIVLPITAWASTHALDWRADFMDGNLAVLLIDLLILDMLIYWWHRFNHQIPFLWRFHEIHHLDAFLDSTSALRFHFGEVFISALVRAAIVITLDIPFETIVIFEICVLISTIFHHSNLKLPRALERFLSPLVITPAMHWIHHHAVRKDTDSNYGTVLSCWDRIFGSHNRTIRTPTMRIGVEGVEEKDITGLLLKPFKPRKH